MRKKHSFSFFQPLTSLLFLCVSFRIRNSILFPVRDLNRGLPSLYFHPSYLLSLLLWLEDPLEAVVPPLPPLHCPHCTALHWLHPCTTPCNPSPPTSSISGTSRQTNMSPGSLLPLSLSHTHVTQSRRSWWPEMPAGICVCVCGRCVRGDGRRRTELRTGLRGARTVRKLYVHCARIVHTGVALHGTLSLSPPTNP